MPFLMPLRESLGYLSLRKVHEALGNHIEFVSPELIENTRVLVLVAAIARVSATGIGIHVRIDHTGSHATRPQRLADRFTLEPTVSEDDGLPVSFSICYVGARDELVPLEETALFPAALPDTSRADARQRTGLSGARPSVPPLK